jgi:hypothetical protein
VFRKFHFIHSHEVIISEYEHNRIILAFFWHVFIFRWHFNSFISQTVPCTRNNVDEYSQSRTYRDQETWTVDLFRGYEKSKKPYLMSFVITKVETFHKYWNLNNTAADTWKLATLIFAVSEALRNQVSVNCQKSYLSFLIHIRAIALVRSVSARACVGENDGLQYKLSLHDTPYKSWVSILDN